MMCKLDTDMWVLYTIMYFIHKMRLFYSFSSSPTDFQNNYVACLHWRKEVYEYAYILNKKKK